MAIELNAEERQQQEERIELIKQSWDDLCDNHQYKDEFKNVCYLSLPIVEELTYRYIVDTIRIKKFHPKEINVIDEYKIAGYLSYWICKLRPVQYNEMLDRFTKTQSVINEELSFHIAIARINDERVIKNRPKINFQSKQDETKKFINNLFYTLKFRLNTGDTISQIWKLTEVF